MIFAGAFKPTNYEGLWSLAFPEDILRDRPLFESYDTYGGSLRYLTLTLTMNAAQTNQNRFTDALLDFEFEGRWLAKMQTQRFADRQLRFHLGSEHDLDMMLLFGVQGTVERMPA